MRRGISALLLLLRLLLMLLWVGVQRHHHTLGDTQRSHNQNENLHSSHSDKGRTVRKINKDYEGNNQVNGERGGVIFSLFQQKSSMAMTTFFFVFPYYVC
jgi:hypothetical protein